jgi:hypothetical protein
MANESSTVISGRMELDSHADTIVLGNNTIILQYTSCECDVLPYADSFEYEPFRNVPIVTGATAVTSLATGETLIVVFHEAIWMGSQLDFSLLNPNQLQHHGVIVQDNPCADMSLHIASLDNTLVMPMQTEGTTIFFDSRTSTNSELANCSHIILSSQAPWNPREVEFPTPAHHIKEGHDTLMHEIGRVRCFNLSNDVHDQVSINQLIVDRLISEVRVNGDAAHDVPLPWTFVSNNRHSGVSAQVLSERWYIGLMQAQETINVTTQNCARSAILPAGRRF